MKGNPVNPIHTNDETIPKNQVDAGLDPIPEDHVDVETVPALGNHVDEATLILKNHVDKETIHICKGMLPEVWTLTRIKGITTLLWMP